MRYVGLLLLFVLTAQAAPDTAPVCDIVLDLDGTLVDVVEPKEMTRYDIPVVVRRETYVHRVYSGARELVDRLRQTPGVRISFFSNGVSERNERLLRAIKLADGKSMADVAYRILSRTDCSATNVRAAFQQGLGTFDESLQSDCYPGGIKKDLREINADLRCVVLVDDNPSYIVGGQEHNLLLVEGNNPRRLHLIAGQLAEALERRQASGNGVLRHLHGRQIYKLSEAEKRRYAWEGAKWIFPIERCMDKLGRRWRDGK